MSFIDPSYLELARLISRPLTEEFEYPWDIVRSVFWGFIPIALLSLITGLALDPTPEYIQEKKLFFDIAFWAGIGVIGLYAACSRRAYLVHKQKESEKSNRVRKFRE